MKKILIIVYNLKNGGVERVLSVIANFLANKGYDTNILAIYNDEICYKLDPRIHYTYVPLIQLYHHQSHLEKVKTMVGIYKEMKRVDPDCVIGFDDAIIFFSAPSVWLLRKKFIVSERNDPSKNTRALKIARQLAYDISRHVVFQTPDAQKFFPKRTRKKSVIIPNPLKNDLPYHKDTYNQNIVMACRLRAQKNIHLAIEGFSKFHALHPGYKLVIYGEGELKEELEAYAEKLSVGNNVIFPGHTDQIYEIMSEAAMYLSTSDYEGISNSMLEALAIGVPSICTDCPVGGARMLIENNMNGILVPVRDAEAVASAMSKIADDRYFALSLSQKSVKIREKLNIEKICPQWEALF